MTISSTKYYIELGMILNSSATLQSSPQKSIYTFTKCVDIIEASILGGTSTLTGLPEKIIVESKIEELEIYFIAHCIRIYGL